MAYANLSCERAVSREASDIRVLISDSGNSYSYIGKDATGIPKDRPTMEFGWFTPETPDAELSRTTLHEFGHALGFLHEHQHPRAAIEWDRPAVYEYFRRAFGSGKSEEEYRAFVDANVLNRITIPVVATDFDPKSVMLYPIPKELTLNGFSSGLNSTLSSSDRALVIRLYPGRPYMHYTLQTGTGLHKTDDSFAFLLGSNRDLFAIKKSRTGSSSTEVHVLSAASGYQAFTVHTGTVLHETDASFDFLLGSNNDLFAIKKSGTGSSSTEVHILSAASGYRAFSLQTGTCLHETDASFDFLLAPNRDLIAIKKSRTGSSSTEVHILSAASGYRAFSLQTGTCLHETDASFDFLLAPNSDIVAIKKSGTGSDSTEIHVLSAASGYRAFSMQTGTCLHETGPTFDFLMASNREVIAIKKEGTGTGTTEVHVLSSS